MTAGEGSRKLICPAGNCSRCAMRTRCARSDLNLHCHFSKETTTAPYGLAGLAQASAAIEKPRQQARRPEGGPGVRKSEH